MSTAAPHIDNAIEVARIMGVAARELLAKSNPAAADVLRRAFRRDMTVFGFDSAGIDALGLPHRSARAPIWYLPGRVAGHGAFGRRPEEQLGEDLLRPFFNRGGTMILERDGLLMIDPDASLRAPAALEIVGVGGRAISALAWPKTLTPLYWIDEQTQLLDDVGDRDVLADGSDGRPLIVRGNVGAGSFVHFASSIAPWRRESRVDAERITPAEIAERAKIVPVGPLADRDATVPEKLAIALLTSLAVVAGVIANALKQDAK